MEKFDEGRFVSLSAIVREKRKTPHLGRKALQEAKDDGVLSAGKGPFTLKEAKEIWKRL